MVFLVPSFLLERGTHFGVALSAFREDVVFFASFKRRPAARRLDVVTGQENDRLHLACLLLTAPLLAGFKGDPQGTPPFSGSFK